MKHLILASTAAMTLAACTTTGTLERNAAYGTAGGAALGAIIGNNAGSGNAKRGAAIGAATGALAGIIATGYENQNRQGGQYRPHAQHGSHSYPSQGYQTQGYQSHGHQSHGHAGHSHAHHGSYGQSSGYGQQCTPCSPSTKTYSGHSGSTSYSSHSTAGNGASYDQYAGRYYSTDPSTGNTYWQDGTLRTTRR